MSDPAKAVFLSYASQDAEAVERIAEALRAAGVEVWFDKNELVGGDAWDAKIRGQIASCALFVPVISAATQARTEGYFRLEWRLADQRTHLMAKGRPFLLPVVIDDTRDAEAHVPDSFTEVQWTRLPGVETPPAFCARVKQLLDGNVGGALRPDSSSQAGHKGPPTKETVRWLKPVLAAAAIGIAVLAYTLVTRRAPESAVVPPLVPVSAPTIVQPVSEARKLANQAMQLLEDPNFTRETSWLADELCQRALALDAGDAEVWAVAAFASHNLFSNTYDTSAGRREKARSQAARASQLDPQSVRGALAVARCLEGTGNDGELVRIVQELHRRAPADQQVLFSLVRAEGSVGNEIAVQDLIRKFRALPRTGLFPLALWFEELRLRTLGRYAEAEAILDEMLADPVVLRGVYYEKLNLLMRSWHDLAAAAPFIEKIPARFRQEPAFGSAIAYYWLWRAEPEKALQALAQVPQDFFEEYSAREPKGYLTGWAHAIAKRPAAAQAEWRAALTLVEERLKTDARNTSLLNQRSLLLALTGQREAAREAWQLRVELGGEQNRVGLEAETQVLVALNEPEAALAAIEREWARRKPMSRVRALPVLRYHPAYAAIRGDPRLQRILKEDETELQSLKEQQTRSAPAQEPTTASSAADAKSVAVLPFVNGSGDKDNEFFSDGISEELITALGKIPGLKVPASTSSFHFKGKDTPLAEIARQLNVAHVIEGNVRRVGTRVRINAKLIKAADGFPVWSSGNIDLDRELKDVLALQEEIAGRIAAALQLKLGGSTMSAPVNPEAYPLLLQARSFNRRQDNDGWKKSIAACRAALAIDPGCAPAAAEIARSYIQLARFGGIRPADGFREARPAAELALKLDPTLPEAHNAMGWVQRTADWNFAGADASFRRAFELAPRNADLIRDYAIIRNNRGFWDEAIALGRRALELDPFNASTHGHLALFLGWGGLPSEAEAVLQRGLELAPDAVEWRAFLARFQIMQGNLDAAAASAAREPSERYSLSARGLVAFTRKDRAAGEALRTELIEKYSDSMSFYIAEIYAVAGEIDRAFEWLERARAQRDTGVAWSRSRANFEHLGHDPRWEAFLKTVGLGGEGVK